MNKYFKLNTIPDPIRYDLIKYRNEGKLPPEFLQAMIANNIQLAVLLAPTREIKAMLPYLRSFLNEWLPSCARGSYEQMKRWASLGGVVGATSCGPHTACRVLEIPQINSNIKEYSPKNPQRRNHFQTLSMVKPDALS